MNECLFPVNVLVLFLERRQADFGEKMPANLSEHIKQCRACERLVNNRKLSEVFTRCYRNMQKITGTAEVFSISHPEPSPGHLWKFTHGKEKTPEFCVITSDRFRAAQHLEYAIRIVPVFFNPLKEETSAEDILLKATETSLTVPLMLEFWNERPIHTKQLKEYAGSLSTEQWHRLKNKLENPPDDHLSNTVQIFRNSEIIRGMFFSSDVFTALESSENLEESVQQMATIEMVFTGLKNKIKKFFSTASSEFISPFRLPNFSIRESSASYSLISASSTPSARAVLTHFYKILCLFVVENDLPITVRRDHDKMLRIIHKTGKNISLALTLRNGDQKIFSNNTEKIEISIESISTFQLNEITVLELREGSIDCRPKN
ncbi:MAG: hypothetical protein EOM80_12700 [Erysipelotrichia bacterium]|nr:hypothetical protein [Erysipelotrichia bacterium]